MLDVAQESRLLPSGDVLLTLVDMLAVNAVNIQTEMWERRDGRWCKSRAWRFVDVNDLVLMVGCLSVCRHSTHVLLSP